ncbi:MAG: outer membrane protein transport protein [candidate division Zixibacteria bacterium]|nr:outer membrane protein transport protein [candidate division Zixibacteria bacterium]
MRRVLVVLLIVGMAAVASAQDLGIFEEVTAGNSFGLGARQMAMGGTGIASSMDGAALYYNPAALARIYRIEFQLGLTHQKFSNESSQNPGRYDGFTSLVNKADIDQTKTRFGTINLAVPVPTYRGSLVIAFGANRIMSFDRAALNHLVDDSLGYELDDYAKEFETGSIYLYTAAAGVDVSPNVSLGLALNVYSGKDKFVYTEAFHDDVIPSNSYEYESETTEDYIAASIKGGLLARPNADWTIGLTVESPLDWQIEQNFSDYEGSSKVEYDLSRPFIFGAGLAFTPGRLTLTGDAEYADWSQTSYNDNPFMEIDNDTLSSLYRDVLNLRAGAEYQFPAQGLSLRAGIFSNPLAYDSRFIEDDQFGYSLGAGWLIDKVIMLEGAFVHGSFTRLYTGPNDYSVTAKDSYSRVYFTMSYRY